jgi:Uma2 family endonuclease
VGVPKGYELVDGKLVELNAGAKSGWVGMRLARRLDEHCEATGAGWAFGAETVCRCFDGKKTARKPDTSFVGHGRLKGEQLPPGDLFLAPDLAVEVVSPKDTVYELDAKVEDSLAAGVSLVWVVNPQTRTVVVHRHNGTMSKVREGQELDGEEVVPGFRCSVAAFLPLPAQESNGQQS